MDVQQHPSGNGSAPRLHVPVANPLGDTTLFAYIDVLRRRWWLILLATIVAGGAGWWAERHREAHDQFTASVTVQLEQQQSPLEGLVAGANRSESPSNIASQVEVLRSRAVVGGVVDSIGQFQTTVQEKDASSSDLLTQVSVGRDARTGTYRVSRAGKVLRLFRGGSNRVLAETGQGGRLQGPGFSFQVASGWIGDEAEVSILNRDEAIDRLTGALNIQNVPGTGLIKVSLTAEDPELAANAVNVLAAVYQRHTALTARNAASRRRELVTTQLAQVTDSLAAARQALTSYQQSAGGVDPQGQGQLISTSLADAQKELQDLRFQESNLEEVVGALRAGNTDQALRKIAVSRDLIPAGAELYNRLQQLQIERSRLTASRYGYKDGGPGVDVVDSLIVATKDEIRETAEQSLSLARSRRAAAEARVGSLQGQMGSIPGRTNSLAQLQERVAALQKVYDVLTDRSREAQIAEEVVASGAKIVDPATVPTRPDAQRPGRYIFLALAIGLMLGTGGTFMLEYFDTSVRRADEIKHLTGLEVIASVPELKEARDGERPMVVAGTERSPAAQAFHMLRTTLHFLQAEKAQVLGITSASPEEGKSTLTANLALAMADHGARVLLIDADLHRPKQHEMFQLEQGPGLSDVLVGDISPARALRPHSIKGLYVLPAGTSVPDPARLLESEAFVKFLSEAREKVDTILLDLPPVLAVADSAAMASSLDAVLTVARYGTTSKYTLLRAVDRLRQLNAPLLGIILNRVPIGSGGRYSGYYGYYGYHYDYSSYYGASDKRKSRKKKGLGRLLSRA